jgi:sec-independent protein translocase protein TatB
MKIGFTEIIVIFIVALIVIGPDKLPYYARKLGAGLREFRKATDDMTKDIRESVVEPLEEAQKPIREAMEQFEQLDRDVRKNFKETSESLNSIGKVKKPDKAADEQQDGKNTAASYVNENAEKYANEDHAEALPEDIFAD